MGYHLWAYPTPQWTSGRVCFFTLMPLELAHPYSHILMPSTHCSHHQDQHHWVRLRMHSLSAVTCDRWGQLCRMPPTVRNGASLTQALDIYMFPCDCPNQGDHSPHIHPCSLVVI